MSERTLIVSVHPFRRTARQRERQLQAALDGNPSAMHLLVSDRIPYWARGVRVEKAGRFSWAVIATSRRGH